MGSLFGHIVMGFTSQAENLATEGLNCLFQTLLMRKMEYLSF